MGYRADRAAGAGEEIDGLEDEYNDLKEEFDERVEDIKERLEKTWHAITESLENSIPDINYFPIPEADEAEEIGEGLYNSDRDYMEQLEAYKTFQGK